MAGAQGVMRHGWAGMAFWSELFVFWTVLVGGSGVSRCTVHVFGRF